jgi:hypothetical protein
MYWHFVDRSFREFWLTPSVLHKHGDAGFDTNAARRAASLWLLRSIEVCDGYASSKGYRFMRGWMPPYPETSGYIIPTLLLLANEENETTSYSLIAQKIGEWLIKRQLPNGGFLGGEVGTLTEPDVFDTGMIVLGFNALLHEFDVPEVRLALARACRFLLSAMDGAGCFVRHINHGVLHAYNVRAAWGLLAAGSLLAEDSFIEAANRNARWTISQQNEAGFFRNNVFKRGGNANTHGTAYVMRGLLEIHELSGEPAYLTAVLRAARALQKRYHENGWIASELAPDWGFLSSHICLTGYAQLAIIYYRLYQKTSDETFRQTADQLLQDVGRTQDLGDQSKPYYGAIAGSFPIYGRYAPLQYPNWASKFFIDALLARQQIETGRARFAFQRYSG